MRVRTILILGIFVREAFSFWTGHPFDFEIWVRTGYWVVRGLSPYAPLPFAPGVSFANDFGNGNNAAIGYLPLWPLLLGAIYGLYSVVGFGNALVFYFLLKQPVILADALLALLLFTYVRRRNPVMAQKVLILWLFSPVTIVVSAIWGTFDSMAMLFVLLALLAPAGRARSAWDGIAAFAKSIPVIFVLPLSYSRKSRWVNFAVALGIPTLSTAVIVYLAGWPVTGQHYTVLSTLENTLQVYGYPLSLWGTWVFLNKLNVLSNATFQGVLSWGVYLWIPAVVAASLAARRWFGFATDRSIIQSLLVITLTFLLSRGQVNEQYSIYLLALLLIDATLWNPKRMRLFYAVSLVIIAAIVTNNVLLIRFLSPVYPGALQFEAGIITSTGQLRDVLLYIEGLAFSGLNLWYLAALIKERRPRGTSFETAGPRRVELEGRIVGVFGTDSSVKAGLLDPITKKSEAEGGVVVHRRVEAGINYSFLDDAQFPEKVQGYSRIASISDYALYVLPKFAKIAPPDGELAVVVDAFGLEGSIVAVDEEPPSAIGSYFKGTRLEGFGASSRSSKSSVVDLSAVKAGPNVPPKGTLIYIDRAFSVKGVGVVVLGFVLGGRVNIHDELRLVPNTDGKTAEVRGIQVSDVDQESVGRGLRVGLSLRGVELKDLDKVSWMDDGSFQVKEKISFEFKQSRFYRQSVDGRDMHLQLPGEILTCRLEAEGPGSGVVTASLPSAAPVWGGMRVGVVDLNGKGLRLAGGGTCRAEF